MKWVARVLLAPLALVAVYLLAAVAGALVPANAGWREAGDGVTVYVGTNGVHTDLTLPLVAAGVDWRGLVRPEHLRAPARAGRWLTFGWGERAFYLDVRGWENFTLAAGVRAVAGGDTLVHVDHYDAPQPDMRAVRLTPAQYRALAGHVLASFALDAAERSRPLPGQGYTDADAFYEGRGRYNAFTTCNQWTRDALAAAGVRVGVWTPFAQGLLWRFPRLPREPVERIVPPVGERR